MKREFQNTFFLDYPQAWNAFFCLEEPVSHTDLLFDLLAEIRNADFEPPTSHEIHFASDRLRYPISSYVLASRSDVPRLLRRFYALTIWIKRGILAAHLQEKDCENADPEQFLVLDDETALDRFMKHLLEAQHARRAINPSEFEMGDDDAICQFQPELNILLQNFERDWHGQFGEYPEHDKENIEPVGEANVMGLAAESISEQHLLDNRYR